MTTEPTPEASFEAVPTAACANCQGPVLIRRPSLTGKHFCALKPCQAAKGRFYYRRRVDGDAVREEQNRVLLEQERDQRIIQVFTAFAKGERVTCADCGRTDALPDYVHPDLEGGACRALAVKSMPSGLGGPIVSAIWPPA